MSDFFQIEGVASTETEDSFGEVILQHGVDLSLVEDGLVSINIEHGEGFPIEEMAVVGLLTKAELRNESLYVKGRIYRQHQYASAIYRELTKPNCELFLSIELVDCEYGRGSNSNVVTGGKLVAVALTKDPANSGTYVELIKSLRDPTLRQLAAELRKLQQLVTAMNHRHQRKKRVTVKVLRVI